MISITLTKKNSSITSVSVSGHAGQADYGQDIVCAGISTVVQTALLGLLKVAKIDISHHSHDGFLQFSLPENLTQNQRHDADVILNTMHVAMQDFLTEYKNIIKLEVN